MTVIVKKNVPSGTIILSRPEKRNALTRQMLTEISQAFTDLHGEKQVRAVILTGAGSAFCAGMDLAEMQQTASQPDAQEQWYRDSLQYRELIEQMLQFPKPIIAAVNGPAMAGGAGLVLASDLVVATASAMFGLPEPKRGIVAGIVSPLLAFRIGGGAATHLLLRANTIEAQQALSRGIYHEIVADDLIWASSHELAKEIAQSAPEAIQLTKRMIYENIGEQLLTQLSAGAAMSATARTTEAAAEGLTAFFEKRNPKWK
ncbi:putative enoyl-CoA hydratase echA8 [Anatilimnocola aggregata]|uniref:Putative enoyl-CoA hydratase echA8 n=1 Tax=Anatilimnocola aggregata TaxID=2528021 RepID=A0A517YEV5_9BACT|nr:enoyl-CoA hydratase/isomerase family protein [Anatilimnocola aggregata]QDU28760.1 putative enoyl-CoA hydratase echA8 [Anatilimnocola aggregata]